MLDSLIVKLKEEIAIDGPSGTSISVVWDYVLNILTEIAKESKISTIKPIIDKKYKSFIWNYLKLEKDLEFYENIQCMSGDSEKEIPSPETDSTASKNSKRKAPEKNTLEKKIKKAKENKNDSDDFESETEKEEIKMSSTAKKNQENSENTINEKNQDLKLIENAREMNYNDISRYGESLYIVATAELQNEQLYIGVPTGVSLTSNLVAILKHILRSRSKGFYQSELSRVFEIDGRSTGHYCKSLEEKGCIVRNGVSVYTTRTNICLHSRYAAGKKSVDMSKVTEQSDKRFYNVNINNQSFSQIELRDAMIELVKDAPGQRILAKDVLEALGFNESRQKQEKNL